MLKVIPLRYGTIFKKAFRDPLVFSRFASDVLGMPIEVSSVLQEFSYETPVGQVKVEYDLFAEDTAHRVIVEVQHIREPDFFDRFLHYHLVSIVEQAQTHEQYRAERDVFTLVVLTTPPRDRELRFSVAVSDADPVSEVGQRLGIYRHRLVFLNPKVINDRTPPGARAWMELIADSLDGEVDETRYTDPALMRVVQAAVKSTVTPDELARIKDEAAWEFGRRLDTAAARGEGRAEALRQSVLTVLTARGLAVSDEARAGIDAEQDVATLERWLRAAVTAATAGDALL